MAEAPIPSQPTEASLHEAALAYLARYASSKAGLVRVLDRRIARWARAANLDEPDRIAALRATARRIADRLAASGVIDDALFAESRARSLRRAGRSSRAVAAHLSARGIAREMLHTVLPLDREADLEAALVLARRRKLGPFRPAEAAADTLRELGILGRAGFSQEIARAVLAMDADAALDRILQSRQP